MPCPLFVEGTRCHCLAVDGRHVPTLHERDRFCRTGESSRCPTWLGYLELGRRLSEEQYLAIWIPERPRRAASVH